MNFNYGTTRKVVVTDRNGHVEADVVCTFKRNGEIRPDYFRFSLPDQSMLTYKVENVLSLKENIASLEFLCEYIEDNMMRRVFLFYWIKDTRWTLRK